jgi:hypothetical protein
MFAGLLFWLVLLSVASVRPVGAQGSLEQAASIVEIPVRLSLDRLFEVAEREMPRQAGNWRDWKKTRGIKTKYRAWRGPLYLAMQGDVLFVQAHVRYWVKAYKKLFGALNLRSSCGVNEAPRQAIIGVQIRLTWGPDWMLRPAFRVMPTRFLDRCEMTIADIDVTPFIAKEFQKQLKDRMHKALTTLAPRLQATRRQAERNWLLLQKPVPLWADHWLLLNPTGIALSPLAGRGNQLDARIAVMMVPRIVSASEPTTRHRPLPPLARFYPRSTGLELQLSIDLHYAELSAAMTRQLSGGSIDVAGYRIDVGAIELAGQGQQVRLNVSLGGDAAGELSITADLVFVPERQQFVLTDLECIYAPEDPLLKPQAELFHGFIREALETAANQQLQERTQQWKQSLLTVLDRIMPDEVELDMSAVQLRQVQVSMAEDGIRLSGLTSGHIGVYFP